MGRLPGNSSLKQIGKRKRRVLRQGIVFLENRPRPCPSVPRLLPARGLRYLGSKIR